jgi:uncharacterized protein YndB with AHSA1/START domain
MNDIPAWIAGTERDVRRRQFAGAERHAVVLRRTYDAPVDRVWQALTDPGQIPGWFLPVSGDLREGGNYQFEGNAGGRILECEQPRRVRLEWLFGDTPPSEVTVTVSEAGSGTTVELEHVGAAEDPSAAVQFALGVGPGWDPALVALGQHLAGQAPDASWWLESPEAMDFTKRSVQEWASALKGADVADAQEVDKTADATLAFYTGSGEAPEG